VQKEFYDSYLLVIEPMDFDMKRNLISFREFSFIYVSPSEIERNQILKLCKEMENLRANTIRTKNFVTELRKSIKDLSRSSNIENHLEFLKIISVLFDLAFYTAISHEQNAFLYSFSQPLLNEPFYYCLCSSNRVNIVDILEKVQEKLFQKSKGDRSFVRTNSVDLNRIKN
jgi:hypothetical protein